MPLFEQQSFSSHDNKSTGPSSPAYRPYTQTLCSIPETPFSPLSTTFDATTNSETAHLIRRNREEIKLLEDEITRLRFAVISTFGNEHLQRIPDNVKQDWQDTYMQLFEEADAYLQGSDSWSDHAAYCAGVAK